MSSRTHSSTCTKVVFQTGAKTKGSIDMLSILADLMHNPFYDQLGTKERLGYLVGLGDTSDTLQIYVQGEHDTSFVEGRINNFLHKFRRMLQNMTQAELDERMLPLLERFIVRGSEAKIEELQKFYDELIGFTPGDYRRLSIHASPAVSNGGETLENIPDKRQETNLANITVPGSDDEVATIADVKAELEREVDEDVAVTALSMADSLSVIGFNQIAVEIISPASWKLDCYLRPV